MYYFLSYKVAGEYSIESSHKSMNVDEGSEKARPIVGLLYANAPFSIIFSKT